MVRNIKKEEKDKIHDFGAFNYSIEKMANILDWNPDDIRKLMQDKSSRFYQYYKAGKDKSDYVIDKKLFELALTGDLRALEEFETRRDNEQ